ncbi:50S ribosome-binding GTPase [Macrococcus psychrotolerans]|uniref:50S ribosome-binding GTPase n=2 Tax=Macrococcus psychrotolerans TaxID=3039389 RepID=A0AAU6RGB5_9STAP
MMDKHPLISAYTSFVRNRSNDKIGVIGQPDAGKSALINLLCESKAYISVQTDATLDTKAYAYNDYGYLVDFPGVGTEVMTVKKYKKIIQNVNIKHYLYVFSSKIKAVDIEIIKYLAKQGKDITFIYNKVDTLIDVQGEDNKEALIRDKDVELNVMMKEIIHKKQSYTFTSVVDHTGIDSLKYVLDEIFVTEEALFISRYQDNKYKESYLNYKTQSAFPKLFTPSFKTILLKANYKSLERTIMEHFKIQEEDIIEHAQKCITIQELIDEFEQQNSDKKVSKAMALTKIVQLLRSSFKIKSVNPISMVVTSMLEVGISNAFPVLQAISKYMNEIRQIADDMIVEEQKIYKQQ